MGLPPLAVLGVVDKYRHAPLVIAIKTMRQDVQLCTGDIAHAAEDSQLATGDVAPPEQGPSSPAMICATERSALVA